MQVLNVMEDWSKREVAVTLDGETGLRVFTVQLQPASPEALPGELWPFVALEATGVPRRYDMYSSVKPYLRCSEIHPRAVSPTLYEITCQYTSGPEADEALNEPADISWGDYVVRQPVEYDVDGKLIANVNGQPLDPPIEDELHLTLLHVERNEAYFDGVQQAQYRDSVNKETFMGAPPGTCWLTSLTSRRIIQGELVYYRVTYEIVHNPYEKPEGSGYIGWQRRILNEGTWAWIQVDGDWKFDLLKDKEGEPLSSPVPLAANGTVLAKGAEQIWLYVQMKRTVSWRPLYLE